nr:MAG TPA: hypothetical protein [Caudoviricetes sp.]
MKRLNKDGKSDVIFLSFFHSLLYSLYSLFLFMAVKPDLSKIASLEHANN